MEESVKRFMETSPLREEWRAVLCEETEQPYFASLCEKVTQARERGRVYPPAELIFSALNETPPQAVRCVILGQDPYHGAGQAHGLAFSVLDGVKLPPSLRNIYKEYVDDLGYPMPQTGNLLSWARNGVLLLNTVLTVEDGQANSHSKFGWQEFTDAVYRVVWRQARPMAFVLWGRQAQAKAERVDCEAGGARLMVETAHPSPLSAKNGFFGSKPFSKVNEFLKEAGEEPINWRLP